jgi:CheY-like chemotaxis protein
MSDRAQHSTVLIVEDDAPLAALLRDLLLELPGLEVLVASDTVAAHKIFTERHPDLLLLNVNLPGRSGPELLDELRADPRWDNPPVIFVSAAPEQPEIQAAIRRGQALRCIAKPFEVDDVVQAVAAAMPARTAQSLSRG